MEIATPRRWRLLAASLAALSCLCPLLGQECLTTAAATDRGQPALTFDLEVEGMEDILLRGLGVRAQLPPGAATELELWRVSASGTTAVGRESIPSLWTQIARAPLPPAEADGLRWIRLDAPELLAAGSRTGFQLVLVGPGLLLAEQTASPGRADTAVGPLTPRSGRGLDAAFGATLPDGRFLRGGFAAFEEDQPLGFELGDDRAELQLGPDRGSPCRAATAALCPLAPFTLSFSSDQARVFELGISTVAPRPREADGVGAVGQQIINLSLRATQLPVFLFGIATPSFTPLPPSNRFEVSTPAPRVLPVRALQGAALDPSAARGIVLSRAVEITTDAVTQRAPGPRRDEEVLSFDLTAAPFCEATGFTLGGTNFTQLSVSSNGRIAFGALVPDPSPTLTEALSGPPIFGLWTDLDPSAGGTVRMERESGGPLRILFEEVPTFGGGPEVDLELELDPGTGSLALVGLQALDTLPGAAWLGLSLGGGLGATDGGPLDPQQSSGAPGAATDMVYRFGTVTGSLFAADRLEILPTAAGGFTWTLQ